MKNLAKIFMTVVALFAFSCTTDTTYDPTVELGAGQTTVTLSLDDENDAVESRTHITGNDGEKYPLYWSNGDQIALNGVASNPLAIDEGVHTNKAVFTVEGDHGYPRSIVYPAPAKEVKAETKGCYPVTFMSEQPYTEGTFAEGAAPMYAYVSQNTGESVGLTHLAGVMCLSPKAKEGATETVFLKAMVVEVAEGKIAGNFDVDCANGTLTPHADATNTVTVSFPGDGLQLKADATPIYVAVPAGKYGEMKVTLYSTSGYTYATFDTDGKPINAGKVREFPAFEYDDKNAIEDKTFLIYDEVSLSTFADSVSGENAETFNTNYTTVKVVANIDLTGKEWTPINGYTGTFDGGNYEIKGLTAPLFGTTPVAAIKNVKLTGVNINATLSTEQYFGALVNNTTASAVIENCSTSGTMNITLSEPSDFVAIAGIVGGKTKEVEIDLTLADVVNNVNITVDGNANKKTVNFGGVIGYTGNKNTTTFGNLTNNGTLTIDGVTSLYSPQVGGIVGYMHCAINAISGAEVINNGTIEIKGGSVSKLNLGGMVGYINYKPMTLTNFHNKGSINISNNTASSWHNIGGISSYNNTELTLNNVSNTGNITFTGCSYTGTSFMDIGGILGTIQDPLTFTGNIINTGNITVYSSNNTKTGGKVGVAGIIGALFSDSVTASSATVKNSGKVKVIGGKYSAETYFGVGGISGIGSISIENTTNTGDVICATTGAAKVGGLFGNRFYKTSKVDYTGGTSNSKCFANVAAFTWNGKADGALTKSTNVGMITGDAYVADKVSNCHVGGKIGTSATVVTNTDGTLDVEVDYTELDKGTYVNYLYNAPITVTVATKDECGYLSSITAPEDYPLDETTATLIGTADDLVAWATSDTKDEKHVILTDDIDMTGKSWTPIEGFTHIFDGDDHEIKNLTAPLFGNAKASAIQNVRLTGVNIELSTSDLYIGALANQVSDATTIKNCSASGKMTISLSFSNDTARGIGGVIGRIYAATTLSNIVNNVSIEVTCSGTGSATLNTGGIVGQMENTLTAEDLTNNGSITVTGTIGKNLDVGGIMGYQNMSVTFSGAITNNGTITIDNANITGNATHTYKLQLQLGGIIGWQNTDLTINETSTVTNKGAIKVYRDDAETTSESAYKSIGGVVGLSTGTVTGSLTNEGTIEIGNKVAGATSFNGITCLGGVVGRVASASTFNSLTNGTTGAISVKNATFANKTNLGGVVGFVSGASTFNKLTNGGAINVTNTTCSAAPRIGGAVGQIYTAVTMSASGEITNNGAISISGSTLAHDSHFGGVIGLLHQAITNDATNKFTNSGAINFSNSTLKGKFNFGGVFGFNDVAVALNNLHNTATGDITFDGIKANVVTSNTFFNVGGITSYNNVNGSTFNNLTNEGDITIINTAINEWYNVDVAGIMGVMHKNTTLSGEIINKGAISCNMTVADSNYWTVVGGIIGHLFNNVTIDMADVTTIENSGNVTVTGTYDDLRVGGIFGEVTQSFTYTGPMKNSGNVTLGAGVTLTDDTAKTYVGGIVGKTAVPISNARCYCTVTAYPGDHENDGTNNINSGMITGSAYAETNRVTNSHIGGKRDKGDFNSSSKWQSNASDIVVSKELFDVIYYVYNNCIYGDNIDIATAVNAGCGVLSESVDSDPEIPEL